MDAIAKSGLLPETEKQQVRERFATAAKEKDIGNQLFSEGKYNKAAYHYNLV